VLTGSHPIQAAKLSSFAVHHGKDNLDDHLDGHLDGHLDDRQETGYEILQAIRYSTVSGELEDDLLSLQEYQNEEACYFDITLEGESLADPALVELLLGIQELLLHP